MNKDVMKVIMIVYADSVEIKIHPYRQIEAYYDDEKKAKRAMKRIPDSFEVRKFNNTRGIWKLDIWVPNWREHYY